MTHLQRLNKHCTLKWVSSKSAENCFRQSSFSLCPSWYYANNNNHPRFYRTKKVHISESTRRKMRAKRKAARAALLDYLHSTRMLDFMDAESISHNSPCFLQKLLSNIDKERDVRKSVDRYLRYHPINEFEPFFESLGLKEHEFAPFLQRDLMFLSDDFLLLENYRVFCYYGIAREKIGKIYKEASEAFRFGRGVLVSRLLDFEELGLTKPSVAKLVVCSPYILICDVNGGFSNMLGKLKDLGFEYSWVEEHLLENDSYNWSQMFELLCLFDKMGHSKKQLVELIHQNPGILFERTGNSTYSIIGFLLKFGTTISQINLTFLHFPQIKVGKFLLNLRQCVIVFNEIAMDVLEIGKLVRTHPLLLGSCTLKMTSTLLSSLNVGKKRMCDFILENPYELKKLVIGSKIEPLPSDDMIQYMQKTKFLFDLGYVENSSKMNKALKSFRGRGTELKERFECIVGAGLNPEDVASMVRKCPFILGQSNNVLKSKIDFLRNDLGYPVSTLVDFPSFLNYSNQRIKLRLSIYNWLKEQGTGVPNLSLRTIIVNSERWLMNHVNKHPSGPQVWQDLRKNFGYK